MDFDLADQLLIVYGKYNEAVHELFINLKKPSDSVRREVLYDNTIEFGIPVKLVGLSEMCINDSFSRVLIGKHFSHTCLFKN